MANQKKTGQHSEDLLHVRLSPNFKSKLKEAFAQGITDRDGEEYESLSHWVRTLLKQDIARWEQAQKRASKTKQG